MDEDMSPESHLSDAELFGLAAPAAGEPEALPRHLLRCPACSRALREWKASVRAMADQDVDELTRRSPAQWRAAEQATMAAIRRARRPGHRSHPLRWAVGIAASVAVLALAIPARRPMPVVPALPTPPAEVALSPVDRADDALLRDAAYLAQGGDTVVDPDGEDNL
jgi:hypothetical protein